MQNSEKSIFHKSFKKGYKISELYFKIMKYFKKITSCAKLSNQLNEISKKRISLKQEGEDKKSFLSQIKHIKFFGRNSKKNINTILQKKRLDFFISFYYIIKFKKLMMEKSMRFRWEKLKILHFNLISDNSYFPKTQEKKKISNYNLSLKNKRIKYFKKFMFNWLKEKKEFLIIKINEIPIITPDSRLSLIWDIFILILLQFVLFYFPFHIGIEFFIRKKVVLFYDIFRLYLPTGAFSIDIIVRFNTAFYSKGILVIERKKIIKNYLTNSFIPDFFTVFILIGMVFWNKSNYLSIVIITEIFKVKTLVNKFKEHVYFSNFLKNILSLLTLLYKTLYITHLCACIWHFLSMIIIEYYGTGNTWLHIHNLIDEDQWTRYFFLIIN